ncbi:MAG: hypothetical protein AAF943_16590 [Pseudomonadota bacterium]
MSDRVTNAEVEGVLSSIRRLVSGDNRAPRADVPNDIEKGDDQDRLVLTPALRVSDASDAEMRAGDAIEEEPLVDEAEGDEPPDASLLSSLISDEEPLDLYAQPQTRPEVDAWDDFDADEEALIAAAAEEGDVDPEHPALRINRGALRAAPEAEPLEEEVSEPAEAFADDDFGESTARVEEDVTPAADPPLDLEAASPEPVPAGEETAKTDAKAAVLSAKIAALETAIGKISETWEPDEVGESDYAGTNAQSIDWEETEASETFQKPLLAPVQRRRTVPLKQVADHGDDADPSPKIQAFTSQRKSQPKVLDQSDLAGEDASQEALQIPVEIEPPLGGTAFDETGALEEKEPPQALHPVTRTQTRTEEPADDVLSALPEVSVEEVSTAELPTVNWPEPVSAVTLFDEPAEGQNDASAVQEAPLLDETALREIVSEIVRSDLQGALGERITRNVRKLVRREINRALAAQELD